MKKCLFVALFTIMLVVSNLATGGQFLGIKSVQASTQSGRNTYAYEYNGQIYESDLSEDDAWTKAMLDQVEQGNLTMADVEIEYSTFGSRGIIEIPQLIMPMLSGTSLTGRAEWQPNTGAAYLPLQRAKVELYMHWGNFAPLKVDETYTTDNGNYSFDNFSLWEELAIIGFGPVWTAAYQTYSVRIYPESETFRVAKDWLGVNLLDSISDWVAGVIPNWLAYYVSSSTGTWFWQSSGNFGTIQIPYDANGDNETHNAFYISQALVMGQRFVQDLCGYNINKFLNVLYPFSEETPFCFDIFMGIGRSWFDDWQTILHEFGHFIEHNVGTNNVTLIEYFSSPGPNHSGIEDHISLRGKSIGTRFAWTEAWAEAFSYVVIDHYTTGYYASGQALGAGGAEVLGTNINVPTTNADSGEGQEAAITAFLWNLSQQQFFGQNGFWNTTTISGTYSLSNLVNTLNTQYPECRSQIGALMGSFKIAPQILTSTYTPGSSTPPTITWRVNGSQNNPNNQFRIAFYNLDGVQKYETDNVSFSLTPAAAPNQNRRDLDTASYTLTQQEINTALASFSSGETIHIAVKGFRTGSPLTGPYWSATIPEIPESLALSSLVFTPNNNNSEYSLTNILDKQFTGLVRIPSTYNGKPVTQIGNGAFQNSQLAQITIPSSIASIDSNAFENCTNLEKVVIQREIGNITNLGSDAFLGCSSLETIEVPTKRILDYLYATNWESYSDFMHYIEPITDGLTITSVGGKSQYYLFQIVETRFYNFYHHCDNPIEMTIYDDENYVILTNATWDGNPIFIELEEGGLYKLVIETTHSEYFNIHIDEIIETELELGVKYYETLNSYSYAYYTFTTPDAQDDISYTINSIISGARTNMWLYNGYDNLITYDFGDINRNGAKIDYDLAPDTTYTVLLYLTSYYYYDDYTIQFYETNEEVYHLDWGGISKEYFDPFTYDYLNFIVFSYCYDLVFDETTKTITFGMIECFWDVTFDGYPNCPEEYVIGMMIGITYDSFENTLPFFSMNGFYEYQASLPYTYSYSATVTDVSITFSNTEWASFVTQGPRV